MLAAEANHRVANNLMTIAGLIRLQAAGLDRARATLCADDVRNILEETSGRIETVGRLHRLLAQAGGEARIDLSDYLAQVAGAAVASMSARGAMMLTHRSTAPCEISAHQALPIALMVGEIVTNAVKYSHPSGVDGRVEVGCHRTPGGGTLIRVADDGVGLPEGFAPEQDGGLGLRVLRSLARQIGASLTFEQPPIGLVVSVRLPPPRAAMNGK